MVMCCSFASSCPITKNFLSRSVLRKQPPLMQVLLLLIKLSIWTAVIFNAGKSNNLNIFQVEACSDVLVTPGASKDGSAMIAYNADDAALFGFLYHYPATINNPTNEMVKIYDWDTGVSICMNAIHNRDPF